VGWECCCAPPHTEPDEGQNPDSSQLPRRVDDPRAGLPHRATAPALQRFCDARNCVWRGRTAQRSVRRRAPRRGARGGRRRRRGAIQEHAAAVVLMQRGALLLTRSPRWSPRPWHRPPRDADVAHPGGVHPERHTARPGGAGTREVTTGATWAAISTAPAVAHPPHCREIVAMFCAVRAEAAAGFGSRVGVSSAPMRSAELTSRGSSLVARDRREAQHTARAPGSHVASRTDAAPQLRDADAHDSGPVLRPFQAPHDGMQQLCPELSTDLRVQARAAVPSPTAAASAPRSAGAERAAVGHVARQCHRGRMSHADLRTRSTSGGALLPSPETSGRTG
jgi:hypothetical protein